VHRLTALLLGLILARPLLAAAAPDAVTILRDAWGVPHVFTDGPGARARGSFGNGYAQAEDRLFQMDILRRAATGRLAEMLGSDYLLMDRVVRRDDLTEMERHVVFKRLDRRTRQALAAYRDGVNAFIQRVTLDRTLLPFEFLGTPPAPWTVEDSVAVAVLEFNVFGANGGQEVINADLLLDLLARYPEAEAKGIFDDFCWIDDPAAPTTIAPEDGIVKYHDRVTRFPDAQLALVRRYPDAIRGAAAQLRSEVGLLGGLGGHRHASNAIVIAPSFSTTGHPLLLGGPQTGLNTPSFFWEIGLHGGGYDAEGVIAPAGPGVLIGRGPNFLMSITSGILDNVDTFVETIDPKHPTRYLFRGRSLPFKRRVETIHVSRSPDVTAEVLSTIHGPVFFVDRTAGIAFSRQASFRGRELAAAAAIANSLGFAHSLQQFDALTRRVAPSLNLHYADADGNIAYFHRGARPRRPRNTDPRLPLDGRGTMEWTGIVPPSRMPSVVNPKRGFITNWNNQPVTGWSAGEQRETWGVVDRVAVFIDALEEARAAGRKLTVDDVKALMRRAAVSDIFAARILPFLEDAVAARNEPTDMPLPAAVARIRAWVDAGASLEAVGPVVPDPGAAIYSEFRTAAQVAVLATPLGNAFRPMFYPVVNAGNQEDDHGSFTSPDALFLRTLLSAGPVPGGAVPPGLLAVSRDYFAPGTRATVLAAALESALATLTARYGTSDQTLWLLPALTETYRDLGTIGSVFGQTVMARENRGSFNVVGELGNPIRAEIIVPPGESGTFTTADLHAEPPHLRDQLRPYEAFSYRRQPFAADELEPPLTTETIPLH
jgi:penicillin amidase